MFIEFQRHLSMRQRLRKPRHHLKALSARLQRNKSPESERLGERVEIGTPRLRTSPAAVDETKARQKVGVQVLGERGADAPRERDSVAADR